MLLGSSTPLEAGRVKADFLLWVLLPLVQRLSLLGPSSQSSLDPHGVSVFLGGHL